MAKRTQATGRSSWGWKPWAIGIGCLFLAYRSLFVGDAHEIGPVRDRIAGVFDTFGLLPQAPGFDSEHGFGGKTTLIHRQMVNDPAYARRMMELTGVEMLPGPEDAEWWNVFIIRLVPIDSDLKAAVSFYAESQLCTLDPVLAQRYTSQCQVAPAPVPAASATDAPVPAPTAEPQVAEAVAPPRARPDGGCEVGSDYYRQIGASQVICGCDYDYYAQSRDGNDVCAGGLYDYHAQSRNGNDVACGGQYDYHAQSRDGNAVCAGGLYDYYAQSRNGNAVACGGLYDYKATSRDGSMTCYGGRYS